MDHIDYLNFRKDSSTKFKLKLDNAKLKLTTPEGIEDTDSRTVSGNTIEEEHAIQNFRHETKAPKQVLKPRSASEDAYLDVAQNFNTRMLQKRESLHFNPTFGLEYLYPLESTQLKNMQTQVPVVVKSETGQQFYFSNNKLEPRKVGLEDFIKMNLTNQNAMLSTEKGGFNNFAPRRRRRGTLKAFKNAKMHPN